MPSEIYIKQNSTTWRKALSLKIRLSSGWTNVKNVWLNFSGFSWTKVWPLSGVFSISDPYITTTASGSTPIYYDGSPMRIGTTYYGRNGQWDPNGFTISSYTYTWPYYSSSDSTILYDELGNVGTGVYSSPSQALNISNSSTASAIDGKWISFRIMANASNSAYSGTADSLNTYGKIKVIRRTPQNISYSLTGETSVGSVLSFSSSWNITEAYKPDASRSTIKWYRTSSLSNIYEGSTREEIASGVYSYTIVSADTGYYIIAEETTFNTGSDYDIGIDQYINGQNQVTDVTTSQVGSALSITNGRVEDFNDNSGLDNRFDFPVASNQAIRANISGVDSSTSYRIRYRIYNWQNGLYYNIQTGATGAANSVWTAYSADSTGSGDISEVSISGTTASFTDYVFIDETIFDGGTYSGGQYKWQIEIELSAIKTGGTRVYWINPYQSYYLARAVNSTISVSPSSISPGSSTTISGSFLGYPAGNAYPRQYKINYGDGNNSGWLPVGGYSYGTANPTYSISRTYSSSGTYFPSIETIPYYTTNSTSLIVANNLTAPTITLVTSSGPGAAVTAYFSGGSGPYYQIYWTTGAAPTNPVTPDASGSSSPLTDPTGPGSAGSWNMYARSVQTPNETSVGPSTLASSWSSAYVFSVVNPNVAPSISSASISPSSGTAGSTTFTASATVSGTPTPTVTFQWQYLNTSFSYSNVPGATSSSYTPPSNFNIIYPNYGFYCLITATNSAGSAESRPSATLNSPVAIPSGGSVSLSGGSTVGSTITASTSGWSGSPTSYDVFITTALSPNTPTSSSSRVASSNGGSSASYTITSSDAASPVNVFRAFATASNSAGTSGTVQSSNVITTTASAPPPTTPAITSGPSISWSSGNNFTLSATASNATNIEFEVQFANANGGPVQNTVTYFMGATAGSRTTGAQQYSWARTRARANNTSTGLSSAFTAYTGWA